MVTTNFNKEAGIPYTYFWCNKLDPEVVDALQQGHDLGYEEAEKEAAYKADRYMEDGLYDDYDEAYADAISELDDWYEEEPVHYGVYKGVRYQTTWLGGALLLCVFDSPLRGRFAPCSPCIPGGLDGDTQGDFEGFDIPTDWKIKE